MLNINYYLLLIVDERLWRIVLPVGDVVRHVNSNWGNFVFINKSRVILKKNKRNKKVFCKLMQTAEKGSVSQIKVCLDFTKPKSGSSDRG